MDLLIDDFITLAEVEMFKETEQHEALQIKEMEIEYSGVLSLRTLALPTGFKSMRSFILDNEAKSDLLYNTPDQLPVRSGTGQPRYYTITNQIEVDVSPDQSYDVLMTYFQKPTGICSSNTTNIILTNHPDVYLYGALWALFTHADDEAQAMKYYQRFALAINGANQADEAGRYGTAPYAKLNTAIA